MSNRMETLRRLKVLSERGETEGERAAALKAFERLLRASGVTWHPGEAKVQEVGLDVRYRTDHEREFLIRMARYLGVQVYTLTRRKLLKKLQFVGDPSLIKLIPELLDAHREAFLRRVDAFASGLAYSTFPAPQERADEGDEDVEFDPDELAAMRAGFQQGKRVSLHPELEGPRLEGK